MSGVPAQTTGLTTAEAQARLVAQGPNEIRREVREPAWRLFLAQFASPLVWLLLVACVLSVLLDEVADAVAIGVILLLNAVIGFVQEYRAGQAIDALRNLTAPRARVVRDGRAVVLPASEVVEGDVLVLEAGDVVAADAVLLEAHRLSASEAALTGESHPVDKSLSPVADGAPLAERVNAVFMGTAIATGAGRARVVATGMRTELGRIAHLLSSAEDTQTPLQQQLAHVARMLMWICLVLVGAVGALGWLRGMAGLDILLTSVSLAVAAVPEGLPAVVTIALALGVQRLASGAVLVRRLPAVETLGCVTVICTDKTGTLTTGVMTVRELWGADHTVLLDAAAACCDAELGPDDRTGTGDPTEIAILAQAAQIGLRREAIERERARVAVEPFDSATKRMTVLRSDGKLYVKGAVEVVSALSARGAEGVAAANAEMARRGLRVLAVAVGNGPEAKELTFLGLVGIADPPRTEAIDAIAQARRAGIRSVMITGDHATTANAIAHELGLVRAGESPDGIVFARATAEDKLRLVREWKAKGEVVAMTGDGVNDAPALREAHIGVAMGRTGTEVTKEAADVVLTDDNYASIVAAVREGRGIYENIRKSLVYLLAGNLGEIALMLVGAAAGLPVPLLPIQLLWVNLVTDGLPALALVTDPPARDLLERPPRPPSEPILGAAQWRSLIPTGLLVAAVSLGVYAWALRDRDVTTARTLAFSTLVFGEMLRSFSARSTRLLLWEVGALTNLKLVGVVVLSVALQLALLFIPAVRDLFQLAELGGRDLLIAAGLGFVPVSIIELLKLVRRALGARDVPPSA